MNVSIEELMRLAGVMSQTSKPAEPVAVAVDTPCGCGESVEESKWANSTDHFDGEPHEDEEMASGSAHELSLRRYMGANGMPVQVEEDHTPESMLESYKQFKEASTINGVKQKADDMVWKSTQMSKEEAIAKYGKENVKVGMFKRGTGEEDVQIRVRHGDSLGEGRMKHQLEDIASEMELEDFVANAGDYGMDEQEAVEFWQTVNGLDEAVGQFAEAYFDLIDRVGGDDEATRLVNNEALAYLGGSARQEIIDGDDNYEDYMAPNDVAGEITRYMSGDDIKDFVDHFERHYDLNSEEEMDEAILSPEEFMKGRGERREKSSNLEIYSDYKEMEATGDADPAQFVMDKYGITPEKLEMILGDLDESVKEIYADEEVMEAPTMDTTQLVNMMKNAGLSEDSIEHYRPKLAETKVDEEDVEEGNEFTKALADAKKAGKKEFEVDGKKYKVNEAANKKFQVESNVEESATDVLRYQLRRLAGLE